MTLPPPSRPRKPNKPLAPPALAQVEAWQGRLYVAAEGASLRAEDRRKASLVHALLAEIARAASRISKASELVVVDAAAGKAYVGLLAAQLVMGERGGRVIAIEREPARVASCQAAAARLEGARAAVECRCGLVAERDLWPGEPSIVVALHACGSASDDVIEAAVATRARALLLVPCCTGASVASEPRALRAAEDLGFPRHAAVRRTFVESWVAAERTLRLEAAGYETEVVPLVAPTVTPYNLLFRARRVGEPGRMKQAALRWARMQNAAGSIDDPAAPPLSRST